MLLCHLFYSLMLCTKLNFVSNQANVVSQPNKSTSKLGNYCLEKSNFMLSAARDLHYGTFGGSGIFISNPKYRILFRNNCRLVKPDASVYTFQHTPDPCSWKHLLFPVVCLNCYHNLEPSIMCMARSLVEAIVISFLPKKHGNFRWKRPRTKKLLCVMQQFIAPYQFEKNVVA